MRYSQYIQASIISTFLAVGLIGCMVGPNFHPPLPPKITHYTESPHLTKTVSSKGRAGQAQQFIANKDIPGEWWYLFHSPQINYLIRASMANNPNLAAAKAALLQAQYNLYAQIGSTMLPAVNAGLSGERQRFSDTSIGVTAVPSHVFNLFNASVNVSYTLDVFGGLRRQIEASSAQVDFQKYELDAAYLTLTANIVTTSITIASLKEQIKATKTLIASQAKTLSITQKQFYLGGVSRNDVLAQEAQLEQLRATLPPLQQSLAQNKHALSVLIGELPNKDQLPDINLNHLHLPSHLPIGLPSKLTQQRPDVQAALALLHVASANVGVATANLFPQINLTGSYGWEGEVLSHLINPQNIVWNESAALLQPIFNGGALIAKRRAAIAAFQQAFAQYRQTVLQAFQNVADVLRALQHDAETLKAQRRAEQAAYQSLVLTRMQYRLGGVSYPNLLIAQRTYQLALLSRIQAQTARYNDTAALFQALGGGWWNRPALNCDGPLCRNLAQYEIH